MPLPNCCNFDTIRLFRLPAFHIFRSENTFNVIGLRLLERAHLICSTINMSHLRIVSLAILLRFVPIAIVSSANDYTPECPSSDFSGYASGPACESYFICADGTVVSPVTECMYGTIFNEWLSVCDFAANFECGSTRSPTNKPTKQPTVSPTTKLMPTTPSPTLPPVTRSPNANVGVEDALYWAKHDINRKLFVYEAGWGNWRPSTQYRYDGFIRGLQLMYLEGVGDMTFYLGGDVSGEEGVKIGLVNIAAFLAQSMKETIKVRCDKMKQCDGGDTVIILYCLTVVLFLRVVCFPYLVQCL